MNKNKKILTAVLASSLVLSPFATAASASPPAKGNQNESHALKNGNGKKYGVKRTYDFADQNATQNTRSLFAYLNSISGKEVLFGHQHATDEGITITREEGIVESDVKNSVGDYPAVFGWDTLSLQGDEKPGVPGDLEQSRKNLAASMRQAHEMGGVVALSTHFPNFLTGGRYNDTSERVAQSILPGGEKNAEFRAFLDNIALFANELKDDQGELIPVLFRPFHEQNGGWFWWGSKTTSASEYKELYRYTVEYLRDQKDVHNFLYVFSPNGTFSGNADTYLQTYPGDDYVDILGMDQYDNQAAPGTEQFLNNLVDDLAMISRLSEEKGKIPAISEYGYSPQGMKTEGNGDLEWFTKVMDAIKADPDAKKIAYMQTWANFALNGNLFVPYKNAPDGLGDHELLPDFIDYYKDPYTSFLNEVEGVYKYKHVTAAEEDPFMHIVTPTAGSTIEKASTVIRASVLNDNPGKVVYIAEGSEKEVPMTIDSEGYYSADWSPDAQFNGGSADVTVKVYNKKGKVTEEQTVKVFVKVPEILVDGFTFDEDISSVKNNGTYPDTISTEFEHVKIGNDGKLQINVSGLNGGDTWQELKLELEEHGKVDLSQVERVKFDALIPLEAAGESVNATVRGIVMLPPDWNKKFGQETTEKKLTDLETVTIKGEDLAKYSVSIDLNDPEKVAAAESLAFSLVGNGLDLDKGKIYIDNLQLFNTYAEAPKDPSLVDNFESYLGDNGSLRTQFVHAGGDTTSVSLDTAHEAEGSYGLKFDYTLAGSGYAGITKSLGTVDWSSYNKLRFDMVPDGSNQKMVIQINVDGIAFEAYPSLAGTEAEAVEIPFSEFAPAPWDTANAGAILTKQNLQKVTAFSVYVNSVNGYTGSGSLYLDDIRVINDGTGGVPNGGTGPGSMPEELGTLYDFEDGVEGWVIEQNQAAATALSVNGGALQSTFDLAKTAGFELAKVQNVDLSKGSSLSVDVKLSNGTANARLYVKTGGGWTWFDSGITTIDANGYKTLTLDLSKVENASAVKSIGVKIEPVSGTGTAAASIDNVVLW
ncbi:beta-mannosidase [Bacillus salacetis]|uniref:Beta-mannosidase n=1 Tax=Bacillus salacetis TaxID=2315464 RepID=A0A3A1R4Y3_9BACI|nr:glycosyl hydrolase [Bacillus salacetis]RIW34244.1 beta-mannosidase [Bacillus salacetis]